jgi:hypothetical protein
LGLNIPFLKPDGNPVFLFVAPGKRRSLLPAE